MIKQHKNLVPILILLSICLWTTCEVIFTKFEHEGILYDRSLSRTNWLAFIAITIDIGVYVFARKYFKAFVIATVLLGFIGVLNYTSSTYVVNFIIPFQPISLGIGLLYLILNFKRVKAWLDSPKDDTHEALPNINKIEEFKAKYRYKTLEELQVLSADKRFVPEAKIAAKELLEPLLQAQALKSTPYELDNKAE
jgi:hypothetical protein